jgi:hypothetical protein
MVAFSWNQPQGLALLLLLSLQLLHTTTGQTTTVAVVVPTTTKPCAAVRSCAICSTSTPTRCGVCGNNQFLLNGACVAACPAGHLAVGTSRFNRYCEQIFACTALRDSCLQCNANRSACAVCSHMRYLSDGKCVSACPEGSYGRGTGRFNRVCIKDPATPCSTLRNGCFLCDPTNMRCLTCTRGKVLFAGRCIERSACPAITHSVRGAGDFRLRCLPLVIQPNPACTATQCYSCPTDANVCEDCVPRSVLNAGQCVATCPSSTVNLAGFGASRVCVPRPTLPATCQPGQNNCLSCTDNMCTLCDGSRSLFQGLCVESCPAGTLHTVSPAAGRRCA